MDRFETLRQSPLLRSLQERQLRSLAKIAKERTFAEGEYLVRSGRPGGLAMFVILEGTVEVRRGGALLAELGPGDHVGEMAVLLPEEAPRSADVVAASPTTVLQIARWDLLTFLRTNPDVALALLQELAIRLAAADARLAGEGG